VLLAALADGGRLDAGDAVRQAGAVVDGGDDGGGGVVAGLISAYGKRAVGLGVATILAFVLALSADIEGRAAMDLYLLLFAGGGVFYLAYALALAWLFDSRCGGS